MSRSTSKYTYNLTGGANRSLASHSTTNGKPSEFEFSHPRVDDFVAQFQTNLRGFFSGALSRSGRYVPRMTSILEKEGLPPQLAYLPLIESGFRTHAVSRAGAVGPWQLIPGTGRRYGLRIDRYVDERCDPVKSTQAAARYLKDLHEMFGDWHLSLAAYNTGERNISRILEKGNAGDFWAMSDQGYLYQETEDFVPEFLAAVHIAETPEAYGFDAPEHESVHYDLVMVKRPMPLATVAKLSGASPNEVTELNPALHRGVIPPQGYAVRLPKGTKETFQVAIANLDRMPKATLTRGTVKRHGKGTPHKQGSKHGQTVVATNGHPTKVVAAKRHQGTAKVVAKVVRGTQHGKPGRAMQVASVARKSGPSVVATRQKTHARALD
ncbi:MAG: lytic transglycosylase domain-containing protein [Candidatus Binatia bacterium]